MPYIGAHMSITGGFYRALERLSLVGGNTLQIFCKNQRQWHATPLSRYDVSAFRKSWQEHGCIPIAVHCGYLINLASPDNVIAEKSVRALIDELQRTAILGISMIVLHPGAHRGSGVKEALRRCADNLDRAIYESTARPMWILLETTAGHGTVLGATFEDLATIMEYSRHSHCLGVCIDTAHIFAAGYNIASFEGYETTFRKLKETVGLERVRLFHLNDSLGKCGSYIDRHAHIGQGNIGIRTFRTLLNDPLFKDHPMIIETPKEGGLRMDRANIQVLKDLIGS